MKKGISILFVVLLCILSMVGLADAAMHHSGFITSDETWSHSDNPHVVTSNVTVINGATLIIEPGAEVQFDSGNTCLIIGTDAESGKLIQRSKVKGDVRSERA